MNKIQKGFISGLIAGVIYAIIMGSRDLLPDYQVLTPFLFHMFMGGVIGVIFVLVFGKLIKRPVNGLIYGVIYGCIWWFIGAFIFSPHYGISASSSRHVG